MTQQAVDALRADREEVLALGASLSEDEWDAPSDCAGWRVQDVIAHMAIVLRQVAEPGSLTPPVPGDVEASQDRLVAERRDWSSSQVMADYEEISARGVEALAGLQAPGIAETAVTIDNLGTHPLHLIANALAFDHFCHLRNDILRPYGPIERPVPPHDELRLGATLDWMLAGLPQMAPDATRVAVDRPFALRLEGPAGGVWTIGPAGDDGLVEVKEERGDNGAAAAEVRSSTSDFVLWATRRRPWQELDVKVAGDKEYAARVLNAIHVF